MINFDPWFFVANGIIISSVMMIVIYFTLDKKDRKRLGK